MLSGERQHLWWGRNRTALFRARDLQLVLQLLYERHLHDLLVLQCEQRALQDGQLLQSRGVVRVVGHGRGCKLSHRHLRVLEGL